MSGRISITLLLVALAAALAAPAAHGAGAQYEAVSASGDAVFFSTTDRLVPGDTDIRRDVYVRSFDPAVGSFITRQVSVGPVGGNNAFDAEFLGSDAVGDRAYFSTGERLVSADVDRTADIYVRDLVANGTTLVSAGDPSCAASGCGKADEPASVVPDGIAAGGGHVLIATEEALAPGDGDTVADVYVRDLDAETTTLVSVADPACSVGGCGDGSEPAFVLGASDDGLSAVVSTVEALSDEDVDTSVDLYLRDISQGETHLVSAEGECPSELEPDECRPVHGGISADGSHVFFESKERIEEGVDTDSSQDVYDWSGGEAVLASRGPAGFNDVDTARYVDASDDGETVLFSTAESLTADDADELDDVYARREASGTHRVSAGSTGCAPGCGNGDSPVLVVGWLAPDGSRAVFATPESLAGEDQDERADVYLRDLDSGETLLVSLPAASCEAPDCGNAPRNAALAATSSDGSRLFFVTRESLVGGDTDEQADVYVRDLGAGATELVSAGGCGLCGNGPYGAQLEDGVSADGRFVFFTTAERLTNEDDFAGEEDVYLRDEGATLLMSRSNDDELESSLAPPAPDLAATDPASPAASTEPRVIGSGPEAAASIKIYTTPDCSGEPVATGTAVELADPGIAAPAAAGATTEYRATAEADGFTSTCSEPISYSQRTPTDGESGDGSGGESDGEGGDGDGDGGDGSSDGHGSGPSGNEKGGRGSAGDDPDPVPPAPDPTPTHSNGIAYVAPVTRITFGPAFKTRWRRPVFRFADGTGQPGTRFICRVDRRRWRVCASPVRLRALRRGLHVFKVKAVNAVGAWETGVERRRFRMTRTDVRGLRTVRRARLERRRERR